MLKTKNQFGHYVLSADKGKTLTDGEIYTLVCVSNEDINESDWTEIDIAEVPVTEDEATEADYQSALSEFGVKV